MDSFEEMDSFTSNYQKRANDREALLKMISSPTKPTGATYRGSPLKNNPLPILKESPILPIPADNIPTHVNVSKPSPVKISTPTPSLTSNTVNSSVSSNLKSQPFSPARKLFATSSPVKANISPRLARKPLSTVNAMVDKDDPSVLPLSARRALFEQRIRNERFRAMPVSPTNQCEPEAKKSKIVSPEKVCAKVVAHQEKVHTDLLKVNTCNNQQKSISPQTKEIVIEKASSSACQNQPPEIQHSSAVIVDMPKKTVEAPRSKEDDVLLTTKVSSNVNHEKECDEVAEALAAFKEIDEYSVASNDTTHYNTLDTKSDHKYHAELVKTSSDSQNISTSSDVSSINENNDILSPLHNSTKLYPELPLTNELSPSDKLQKNENNVHIVQSPAIRDIKRVTELTPSTSVGSPSTPVRTLSMYRREQKIRACKQQIEAEDDNIKTTVSEQAQKNKLMEKYLEFRANKIQNLQRDAEVLNSIIFQSMRALELCREKHNLSERVEAEKILLINTKKKTSCVNELYRLQNISVKKIDLTEAVEGCIGKIVISNLVLLVKGEFFVSQVSGWDSYDYHFICLLNYNDKVVATEVLSSTQAIDCTGLVFTNPITLSELSKNFKVNLEVYGLALPKKLASHHKKGGTLNLHLTPRSKAKAKYNSPSIGSSARKEHVTSFKLLGHVKLTRENCTMSHLDLADFMYKCPLEGQLLLNATLSADYRATYKSYLNFSEKSGEFSVWNRRWCVLKGYNIYYWRFAEDETDKPHIGTINMKLCVNPIISKASTDICMRPHSFVFLVVEEKNSKVVLTRHLMAADIKKERDEWLAKLNAALQVARYWESDAVHPYDESNLEQLMK